MENTNTQSPDYSGYVPPPPPQPVRRHSSLGIASTCISLVYIIIMVVLVSIVIAQINKSMPYAGMMGSERDNEMTGTIVKFIIGFGINVNIVGLGIGAAGFFQRGKNKLFAIVGSVIHFLFILLTISWIISAFSKIPSVGF